MDPIEKPALPEPYTEMYREMTPVLHEAWANQMHAYADTCRAPLLARIEELEGLLQYLLECPYQIDEATISGCGLKETMRLSPNQVVGNISVTHSWVRRSRAALSAKEKQA